MGDSLPTQINVSAPGRVNLLGEHVDYNQGVVLPAAIDRRVQLQAKPLHERVLHLHAVDLPGDVEISLDKLEKKQDLSGSPLPGWALYPAGVAWALQQLGLDPLGMDVTYTSDIPIGAGLSSSAAVEVAFAKMWQAASGWQLDLVDLALAAQRAEIKYVGVNCGAMDQVTSACGLKDHILKIDMRSLEVEPIPLPKNISIIIADTGIPHNLANSEYNERRHACERAVKILNKWLPGIQSLRDVTLADFNRLVLRLPGLPDQIRTYTRYVIEEMVRVEQGIRCLKESNIVDFGRLMLATHNSLRIQYMVSIPELDALVDIARNLPGCWGARLTGAGFGGCTVNLVEEQKADEFIRRLSEGYTRLTQKTAVIYACRASDGVCASIA